MEEGGRVEWSQNNVVNVFISLKDVRKDFQLRAN